MKLKNTEILCGILVLLLVTGSHAVEVSASLIATIILHGFLAYLDKKDQKLSEKFEAELKEIRSRIESIEIKRALGRA